VFQAQAAHKAKQDFNKRIIEAATTAIKVLDLDADCSIMKCGEPGFLEELPSLTVCRLKQTG